ncbi:transporter major facilitator superfamily [Cupriavidus necator N-1]|uniref:Transporter major facilitator superfamily n=1 Tax=Cupriavidus necator (strain ATCC 43291 / DSM 13513 / CCUG 52238 / LMG 8453 / N-1) TaxID=1042878 RepID=F8GP81_CUPNN|nr:MFS transporter [Cupriavidus necator]AEI80449.1 transporter major facilitator superfamily [Cupriavidus necator N-1]
MTPAPQAGPSRDIALLLAGQAVVTTGLMTLVPIMPLYLRDLAGPAAAHWSSLALAAPGVGALLLAPFAGSWCERWGYRRPLLLSLSAFTASLLLMGLSTHVAGFMVGRLLQGASAVGVLLTICIGRVSTPGMRGRAFGMQESAVATGALLGPVLGGVLQDWWTVRPMLLAVAAANAVLTLLLAWRLREPAPQALPGAGSSRGFAAMLADASLRRWLLAGCLTQAGAFALVNVFALYLQQRYPYDALLGSKTGFLHALGWLAAMLASPLWGRSATAARPCAYSCWPPAAAPSRSRCCRLPMRSGRSARSGSCRARCSPRSRNPCCPIAAPACPRVCTAAPPASPRAP